MSGGAAGPVRGPSPGMDRPGVARRATGASPPGHGFPPAKEVAMNTVPAPATRSRVRVAPSALALLESARQGLADAEDQPDPGGKYVAAHLAALRAAAAVVTVKAEPVT